MATSMYVSNLNESVLGSHFCNILHTLWVNETNPESVRLNPPQCLHAPSLCHLSMLPHLPSALSHLPPSLHCLTCPLSALSHLPSLSTPSHFYLLRHIIFPLLLWLFSQPCSSHSSLSSPTVYSGYNHVLIILYYCMYFYHTLGLNYYWIHYSATWALHNNVLGWKLYIKNYGHGAGHGCEYNNTHQIGGGKGMLLGLLQKLNNMLLTAMILKMAMSSSVLGYLWIVSMYLVSWRRCCLDLIWARTWHNYTEILMHNFDNDLAHGHLQNHGVSSIIV